ncbi:MAG: biopolymer transporter ExbD [Flavobacteriales bacterium]|nr:biopolymer transporter ExbD [Flavobacteriales bacterium]MCB9199496.1 biopolymer transporter ExbD [Flavobacteriales bacterium]HPF68580.1 biopolymer transporter ExbD [Flavobacteriales bacterium]HPJ53715.1 biopolymer transporter ExbD [Flavobacteriales bacterium]HRW90650.1 biopolymer transporter ExbD [Flavobacteriales bacterium]
MSEEFTPRARRPLHKEVSIDMNPMVDLAFLLLTFFMLTTTFSKPQAMELVMPAKPKADEVVEEKPIKASRVVTLLIGPDDRLFWYRGVEDVQVNETGYGKDGLRDLLFRLDGEIEDLVLLIKPMRECVYENMVDMLDELQITGMQRYAMVPEEPADRELLVQQGLLQE